MSERAAKSHDGLVRHELGPSQGHFKAAALTNYGHGHEVSHPVELEISRPQRSGAGPGGRGAGHPDQVTDLVHMRELHDRHSTVSALSLPPRATAVACAAVRSRLGWAGRS